MSSILFYCSSRLFVILFAKILFSFRFLCFFSIHSSHIHNCCSSYLNPYDGDSALKLVGRRPEKKTGTGRLGFHPSFIVLVAWWFCNFTYTRMATVPHILSWFLIGWPRHSPFILPNQEKKKSISSSQSENEWEVSFRRRARERKSAFGNIRTPMFYVSTVLRDGVNQDRHGRESKQTGGHLPRYMGPLPRLVFILFFLSYLWKDHRIERNLTPELVWPWSSTLASSRLDSRKNITENGGNKCGSCFSQDCAENTVST